MSINKIKMDEYLILLLFLGILFVLFFYRAEIFGKKRQQIIQPIKHKSHNKKHKKNKHSHSKKSKSYTESDSSRSSTNESSYKSEKSESDDNISKYSARSNDTFPSIGSKLSHGDNQNDEDTFF